MLTVKEFSEEVGMTTNKIYYLLRSGVLKSKKIGKYRMVYPDQIDIDFCIKKPKPEGYLTMYEASKILGITPQGVAFRIKRGWYKEYTFNDIRHIKQSEIKTAVAKPTEKQIEKQTIKKTLRKCSACGKNTYNRMLCSKCFRNADEEVIY